MSIVGPSFFQDLHKKFESKLLIRGNQLVQFLRKALHFLFNLIVFSIFLCDQVHYKPNKVFLSVEILVFRANLKEEFTDYDQIVK